uniref:Uncharacterized protein n=1 Tax=Oryza meridionalis TaxID=40149 RepID=A0A0E0E1Y1_9ORYZ
MADVDTLYLMQSAPVTHLTGDIAEELYAEITSLWEKLCDNIAGSHKEMMSALDRMRQKCKRIMRAASCRHASDVHRPTGHRFVDDRHRPSTSRLSTSARSSASTCPRPAVRPVEPSMIIRPDNEGSTAVIPFILHASTNGQWQGGFARFAGSSQMGMYQMSINENTQPQGPSFLDMLGHGDWLFSQPPIMQPQTTLMYNPEQMMGYAGSTQSYGEPCSYGGGSSTAQHEIGPSQIDEPPPITQPTQDYGQFDFSGVEEVRRTEAVPRLCSVRPPAISARLPDRAYHLCPGGPDREGSGSVPLIGAVGPTRSRAFSPRDRLCQDRSCKPNPLRAAAPRDHLGTASPFRTIKSVPHPRSVPPNSRTINLHHRLVPASPEHGEGLSRLLSASKRSNASWKTTRRMRKKVVVDAFLPTNTAYDAIQYSLDLYAQHILQNLRQ